MSSFYLIFVADTPQLAMFVIPAKAGIQKCNVLRGFWIPDEQTSGMTVADTPQLAAGLCYRFGHS
jgi:hypothetical protein